MDVASFSVQSDSSATGGRSLHYYTVTMYGGVDDVDRCALCDAASDSLIINSLQPPQPHQFHSVSPWSDDATSPRAAVSLGSSSLVAGGGGGGGQVPGSVRYDVVRPARDGSSTVYSRSPGPSPGRNPGPGMDPSPDPGRSPGQIYDHTRGSRLSTAAVVQPYCYLNTAAVAPTVAQLSPYQQRPCCSGPRSNFTNSQWHQKARSPLILRSVV